MAVHGFPKFLAFLECGCLYFCRADVLSDEWEGALSRPSIELRRQTLARLIAPCDRTRIEDSRSESVKASRKSVFVNCWTLSEHESLAMWDLYVGGRTNGIAIQTTFARLSQCFTSSLHEIWIGKVKYIDYDRELIPPENMLEPFVRKRMAFAHEKEVRAVLMAGMPGTGQPLSDLGINVPVAFSVIIEAIYVSPSSDDWVCELVQSIIERYHLRIVVKTSNLRATPSF